MLVWLSVCRLFAYRPADVTAFQNPVILIKMQIAVVVEILDTIVYVYDCILVVVSVAVVDIHCRESMT